MRRIISCIATMLLAASVAAQTVQTGIDEVRSLIERQPEEAKEAVGELLKGKNKRDAGRVVAVARAYLEAGRTDEAAVYLALAKKADPKAPPVFLLEGDLALQQKEVGRACQAYEQAIYFAPNCTEAYLRYAQAYRTASPALAIEKLEQLKQLSPDCKEADKELAEIYYATNRFDKAAEHYAQFIDTPLTTDDDLLKYAFALFLNHDFEQALTVARRGLEENPRHAAFNRIVMYCCVDLKRYDEAAEAAEAFFRGSDNADYSYLDYRYHSALLEQQGDYRRAAEAYRLYLQALPEKEQTAETIFPLARLYYAEGTATDSIAVQPADRAEALQQADSLFAEVAALAPQSHLGNLWRARTQSALDPETAEGLAKPYYEQVVAVLTAKDDPRYSAALIECYSYLGYFYLLQDNPAASRECWEKILALDPDNATARKALEAMDS